MGHTIDYHLSLPRDCYYINLTTDLLKNQASAQKPRLNCSRVSRSAFCSSKTSHLSFRKFPVANETAFLQKKAQSREVNPNFQNFVTKNSVPFGFPQLNGRQCSEFPKTFPRNFRTIRLHKWSSVIFGSMESATALFSDWCCFLSNAGVDPGGLEHGHVRWDASYI